MTPFRMFSIFIIDNNSKVRPIEADRIHDFFLSLQEKLNTENITLYFSNPVKYKNILTEIRCANRNIGNNVSGKSGPPIPTVPPIRNTGSPYCVPAKPPCWKRKFNFTWITIFWINPTA